METSQHGYKTRTINRIISKKIGDWLSTIESETLRQDIKNDIFVTGGCITSMLLGEKVSDFDIYFQSTSVAKKVADYYIADFEIRNQKVSRKFSEISEDLHGDPFVKIVVKSAGVAAEDNEMEDYQYFEGVDDPNVTEDFVEDLFKLEKEDTLKKEKKKYRAKFVSSNAITLSDDIQLIFRFVGTPDKVHENFDFVHCTNYFNYKNRELVLRPKALESILSKSLFYVGSKYPICTIFRLRKFLNRGWRVSAGQLTKICWQISKLDLENINVLYDQLIGVDVAYFHEVIEKLKTKGDKIDDAYLIKLLDNIFD